MVSLWQMARLVEAVRPGARLILVGDPGQLTSIEAGAVLGDIAAAGGDAIVTLDEVYRYDASIGRVAEAIRRGDADATVAALAGVTWVEDDARVRERAVTTARAVTAAAEAGDGARAIAALGSFRLLCAHRRGPYGVSTWTARIEDWTGAGGAEWYAGRPLLVTANDYGLQLFNGDTGVVIAAEPGLMAAFERVELSPTRLANVETVYAMTVHKAQGSQFDTAAVVLPEPTLPDPHPRAALHRGHARTQGADRRRHRGVGPRRRRPPGRPRLRPARAPHGRNHRSMKLLSIDETAPRSGIVAAIP